MLRCVIAFAILIVGCARQSPDPIAAPPDPANEPTTVALSETAKPKPKRRAARPAPPAETEPEDVQAEDSETTETPVTRVEPSPPVNRSNRCVIGTVEAQGDMIVPVNNARVMLFRAAELLGETRTDSNGKFAWCAGPNLTGAEFEVTVKVSKSPFATVSQSRGWKVGVQEQFDFALIAPSF